ncbi:MAG: TrkA C-terminal domain-containing protein [Gammaproteobacteria bacterium]|nr:TrkA C-terminal domain-containing protein [Gammaproteobacteria bacterium]MCP5201809.1 TrkA C-terminal domain-containing protein [Gammaproteobacteria bacterium]
MAAVLLVIAIAISMIVVRIGATALELTGLPWDRAKFQALSAFSNAGFTTRESEEIVRHPLRRKIVTYLIVLGNAGLVTVIGSFAGSMIEPQPLRVVGNLAIIVGGVAILFWLARRPAITRRLRDRGRRWLARRYAVEMWSAEELLHLDHGYELTRFDLAADSPASGHTLRQLKLRQNAVQVLAIERGLKFFAVPGGEFMLQAGDSMVVYGHRDSVDRLLAPGDDQTHLVIEDVPEVAEQPAGGDDELDDDEDRDGR